MDTLKDEYIDLVDCDIPTAVMNPYEVMDREKIMVDLKNSQGRICAVAIVPYPPGIPVVMPGERLCKESIAVIEHYLLCNVTVLGTYDGKVATVKV